MGAVLRSKVTTKKLICTSENTGVDVRELRSNIKGYHVPNSLLRRSCTMNIITTIIMIGTVIVSRKSCNSLLYNCVSPIFLWFVFTIMHGAEKWKKGEHLVTPHEWYQVNVNCKLNLYLWHGNWNYRLSIYQKHLVVSLSRLAVCHAWNKTLLPFAFCEQLGLCIRTCLALVQSAMHFFCCWRCISD